MLQIFKTVSFAIINWNALEVLSTDACTARRMSLPQLFLEPEIVFHKEVNLDIYIRPAMTWSPTTLPNMPFNLMPCSALSPTVEVMNIELQDILYLHVVNCCVKTLLVTR